MKFRRPAAVRAARRRLRVWPPCPACARVPADRMWPSAAQQNTWPSKPTPFGITRGSHPQSDGSRRGWRHDAKHQFIPFKWLNCQGAGRRLPDRDPGSRRRQYPANPGRRNAGGVQRVGGLAGVCAVDGDEQAPRGLRVIEELHEIRVDVLRNSGVAAKVLDVGTSSTRHVALDERLHPRQQRDGRRLRFRACTGSRRRSPRHGR